MNLRLWLIRMLGGRPQPGTPNCGITQLRYLMSEWTQEELIEAVIDTWRDRRQGDWFTQYYAADRELERTKAILSTRYHNDQELNKAKHMADLEVKNRRLKEEVRQMQVAAERHNRTAYATGLIVNCTGCVAGKPFRGEELTEERVSEVEHLARRLRTWFDRYQDLKKQGRDS